MLRRRRLSQLDQLFLGVPGGNTGDGPDLGVAQFPFLERRSDLRQVIQGMGDTDLLPGSDQIHAAGDVEPVGAIRLLVATPALGKESLCDGLPQRLERLLDRLIRRLLRRLTRDGWLVLDPEQPWLDPEPADTLDSLVAASIRYRVAFGPESGRRTLTLRPRGSPKPSSSISRSALTAVEACGSLPM